MDCLNTPSRRSQLPECGWPRCRMVSTLNGYCVIHAAEIATMAYELSQDSAFEYEAETSR